MNTESKNEKTNHIEEKPKVSYQALIRGFIIEIIIYGGLLVVYFSVVLRFLEEPLTKLFGENLILYAGLGLGLIGVQAFVLEYVTSLLFDILGLHRLSK
jgi:hypothetical protein